uniref:Uncharacterized protein n=2 Tax=Gossypium raimondii TaxID=29730 RepID=A0A0D2SZR6_GOSRA|nr:hypothetical protein B456_006G177700 [Gossypium raimondii]
MLHQRPPWVREEPATRGKRLRPSHRPSATKGTMLVQQCSISLALQTREAKVVVVPPKKTGEANRTKPNVANRRGGGASKAIGEKPLIFGQRPTKERGERFGHYCVRKARKGRQTTAGTRPIMAEERKVVCRICSDLNLIYYKISSKRHSFN